MRMEVYGVVRIGIWVAPAARNESHFSHSLERYWELFGRVFDKATDDVAAGAGNDAGDVAGDDAVLMLYWYGQLMLDAARSSCSIAGPKTALIES